jgi:hypothetical protein
MKTLLAVFFLTAALAFAQQNSPSAQSPDANDLKGMDMPGRDMSQMGSQSSKSSDETNTHVMHSMEGHHMGMGPHMKMTALRSARPGDAERAQKIVVAARAVMDKYNDYHIALNDGFHIFHPEIPQKQYHFTSGRNAIKAQFKFDPENPTSLLYEKEGDGYRLVGVMYTAPKQFTEDDLNQRVPLSIAQWHEHVNFCLPALGHWREMRDPNPKFGMKGSIATEADCSAAGGHFIPLVYNWMVHVYPLEKYEAQIWSTDRQHQHED